MTDHDLGSSGILPGNVDCFPPSNQSAQSDEATPLRPGWIAANEIGPKRQPSVSYANVMSPEQIGVSSFLWGPLCGIVLLAINRARASMPLRLTILTGVALVVLAVTLRFVLRSWLPDSAWVASLGAWILVALVVTWVAASDKDQFMDAGGNWSESTSWVFPTVVGIAIDLVVVIVLIVLFGPDALEVLAL